MHSYVKCNFFSKHTYRTHNMYEALYALALAEDSIWPEKYRVEGYPNIFDFPSQHPNRVREPDVVKDEL